jgi:hypothetical protein
MSTFEVSRENGTFIYHADDLIEVEIIYMAPFITIKDVSTTCDPIDRQEDIFLQGHAADAFIDEVETLWNSEPDMPLDFAERVIASQYAENYWN